MEGNSTKDEKPSTLTRQELKDTFWDFCEKTTAHGWGRVAGASTYIIKILWLVLTVSALTMTTLHITGLVVQYLDYSSEIKWELDVSEIAFPSVTVCNIIPMSMSTAEILLQNQSTNFYQWYNLTKHLDYFEEMAEKINKSYEYELIKNRMTQPIGYFENIGAAEAQYVGHQPMDFLLGCTFGIQHCNYKDNFTYFQNPNYYNCYTFNGGNTSRENLVSTTAGPQSGLSLILYTESDNGDDLYNGTYHTMSNILNAAGIRVVVHAPDTRPSPTERGFDIPPGYSASIGMDVLHHSRLDFPYGDCMDSRPYGSKYVYSSPACLSWCQQKYVIETCNCITALLPLPEENLGLQYCGYWNVSKPEDMVHYFGNITCEMEAITEFATSEAIRVACGYIPPCEESVYETGLSYSYWPLDFSQQDFYSSFVLGHSKYTELKAYTNFANWSTIDLINEGLIRKNFVRLNVYLKALSIEEYLERQAYELTNLASDIGGTFGLWVGMSIITWFEVVELLGNLLHKGIKGVRRRKTSEGKTEPLAEDVSKSEQNSQVALVKE